MDNELIKKYSVVGIFVVLFFVSIVIFSLFESQKVKKETSLRLRIFFSEMIQVVQSSVSEYGSPSEWGITDNADFANNINKTVIEKLHSERVCLNQEQICFHDGYYKNLRGKKTGKKFSDLPSVVLYNGMTIAFEPKENCSNDKNICTIVYADTNGAKKPNQLGKDLFAFMLFNTHSLAFMPYKLTENPSVYINDEQYGCNKNAQTPLYCSSLLFLNNWVIDSRYPW